MKLFRISLGICRVITMRLRSRCDEERWISKIPPFPQFIMTHLLILARKLFSCWSVCAYNSVRSGRWQLVILSPVIPLRASTSSWYGSWHTAQYTADAVASSHRIKVCHMSIVCANIEFEKRKGNNSILTYICIETNHFIACPFIIISEEIAHRNYDEG